MRSLAALLLAVAPVQTTPNVLVVVADDLGWPDRPLLPSLDALAAAGVTFTRAYSQPVCTTSRLEYTFGVLHRREGVGANLDAFDPNEGTLPLSLVSVAEALSGWSSMFVGKWHLGRAPGSSQIQSGAPAHGFGWRAGTPSVIASQAYGYYGWWRVEDGALVPEVTYATDAQRDTFTAWWQGTAEPKLAFLSWSAPHKPWDAPPGYTAQATNRENYEQVVEYLDGALDAALSVVSLDDTFVLFFGDNGTPETAYPLGQPPGIWKGTTHEGGVRVPLMVAGPGVSAGVTTERIVSLSDVPATVAELVGVAAPAEWLDSRSFADELGLWSGDAARAFAFTELYSPNYDDQAVIEPKWKLRRVDPDGSGPLPSANRWYRILSPGVEVPLVPGASTQARLLAELASMPPRAP
jgi:arylsulfatase A-like enzyme